MLEASDDPNAKDAIDYFVYRVRREIGSLAAALGGVDALVFTAGIGENATRVRARILDGLQWLGIELDRAANDREPDGDLDGRFEGARCSSSPPTRRR